MIVVGTCATTGHQLCIRFESAIHLHVFDIAKGQSKCKVKMLPDSNIFPKDRLHICRLCI